VRTTINGEQRELAEGTTLGVLLNELGVEMTGIAVAVNDAVVRRAALPEHTLREGDAVEIIRAVAGG
jgi:thiamine biosynthesis protein ThiS